MANSLEIIAKHLSKKGLKTRVSRETGIPLTVLCRYVPGGADLKLSQIERIAKALGLSAAELLTDPDKASPLLSKRKSHRRALAAR